MRLLNTLKQPPELEDFSGKELPEYAILSHRWGPEEISYKQYVKKQDTHGPGYNKILDFCRFVRQRFDMDWNEPRYAWIDTCCIDKRSSAELSKAINSMYGYYETAVRCYVYLSDVHFRPSPDYYHYQDQSPFRLFGDAHERDEQIEVARDRDEQIRSSEWFTRGWTLQESLANKETIFLNRFWEAIGTKASHYELTARSGPCLGDLLANITGIHQQYLYDPRRLGEATVACKMSWAAHRRTAEPEDRAYSLLGLFGINMTPRYGEGAQAFQRLQKKIIATSTDQSILAWQPERPEALESYGRPMGALARGPEDFARCGKVTSDANVPAWSCTMTSLGLEIRSKCRRARIADPVLSKELGLLVLQLNCLKRGGNEPSDIELSGKILLLEIENQSPFQEPRLYYRVPDDRYHQRESDVYELEWEPSGKLQHLCIKTADPGHWSLDCPIYWKFMADLKSRGRKLPSRTPTSSHYHTLPDDFQTYDTDLLQEMMEGCQGIEEQSCPSELDVRPSDLSLKNTSLHPSADELRLPTFPARVPFPPTDAKEPQFISKLVYDTSSSLDAFDQISAYSSDVEDEDRTLAMGSSTYDFARSRIRQAAPPPESGRTGRLQSPYASDWLDGS